MSISSTAASEKENYAALMAIIEKLGHGNEQVRCRALQNLMTKMSTNILTGAHLELHCKALVPQLLNWFNFDSCPMCTDVLTLINHMAQVRYVVHNNLYLFIFHHYFISFFVMFIVYLPPFFY